MKDTIVSRKLAQLAKDKGFEVPVRARYSFATWGSNKWELFLEPLGVYTNSDKAKYGSISAPTLSLLQKWLREEHNLHIQVSYSVVEYNYNGFAYMGENISIESEVYYSDSYEKCLELVLFEALTMI